MTDQQRPNSEVASELVSDIDATNPTIPVSSISIFNLETRKRIGDSGEFIKCTGTQQEPWPALTGCERGIAPEDGGTEPRSWPAGTPVYEVPWSSIEIVTEIPIPTTAMVGRQFIFRNPVTGNAYTFNVITSPDGTPVIDWVNEPPPDPDAAYVLSLTTGFPTTAAPYGIAIEPGGKIIECEPINAQLRRYNPDGSLDITMTSTYGRGWALASSYVPSIGAATNQLQQFPFVGDIDASNRLYVGDVGNNRIILLDGTSYAFIQSLTGYSFLEAACLDPSGNLYISFGGAIRKQGIFSAFTLAWNVVLNAAQNFKGLACDATHLYVSATTAGVVYKRLASTGAAVLTIGSPGTGNGQLSFPAGIAVDANNLYVSDNDARIAVFNKATGAWVRNIGPSSRSGVAGSLDGIRDVKIDPTTGNLLILSNSRQVIMEYTITGQFIRESLPSAVTAAQTYTIVADQYSQRVYMARDTPRIDRLKGSFRPTDVVVTGAGDIIATDDVNDCLHRFSSAGAFLGGAGGFGTGTLQFNEPKGIGVLSGGNLAIADSLNNRVQIVSPTLAYVSTPIASVPNMGGLAVDGSDNIYVTMVSGSPSIRKYDSGGLPIGTFGTAGNGNGEFSQPRAIDVDSSGRMWVIDTGNNRVHILAADGSYIGKVGSSGSGAFNLSGPYGLVLTSSVQAYVADTGNNRISVANLLDASLGAVQVYSNGAFIAGADILNFGPEFTVTEPSSLEADIVLASGMWVPIAAIPFSAATSVPVNGCFSAAYKVYKIFARYSGSSFATANHWIRMRAAGVDKTTGYPWLRMSETQALAASAGGSGSDTAMAFATTNTSTVFASIIAEVTLFDPFSATERTRMQSQNAHSGNTAYLINSNMGWEGAAMSADGFTIFPNAGTITGDLWILGLKV